MTKIEWTDEVWNPVTGCAKVSEGCRNCYAERMSKRLAGRCGYPEDKPFRVTLHPDRIGRPRRWRKPRRVFVCSMGDLFHEDVPLDFIDQVFITMDNCPRHTFQILTKRPKRMRAVFTLLFANERFPEWPLPNVSLGVSVEDQATADERIPLLLETPAAVRFVSCEPLLGTVRLDKHVVAPADARPPFDGCWRDYLRGSAGRVWGVTGLPRLDWVIVGGESGPGARPCDVNWITSVRRQCSAAAVPCFVKQLGSNSIWREVVKRGGVTNWREKRRPFRDRKGGDPAEWPEDLRVQEWPGEVS